MGETDMPLKGPVDGTSRILRELIRTPSVRKSINVVLSDLDPQNAELLARTLVWEDVEFFLSLMRSLPPVLNIFIIFMQELLRQLDNFPPELLNSFVAGLVEELDAGRLGEGAGTLVMLLLKTGEVEGGELKEAGQQLAGRFAGGLAQALELDVAEGHSSGAAVVERLVPVLSDMVSSLGESASQKGSPASELVASIAEGIQKVSSDNPQFMNSVVSPLQESWRKATKTPGKAAKAPAKKSTKAKGRNN